MDKLSKIIVCIIILATTACTQKTGAEYLQSAQQLKEKQQFYQAIVELKNAIRAEPKNIQARVTLGHIYYLASEFENAEKELRVAKDLGANSDEYYPLLIKSVYYQNDFGRVLVLSEGFQSDSPATLSTVSLFAHLSYLKDESIDVETVEFPSNLLGDDKLIARAYQALAEQEPGKAKNYISQFSSLESETAEKSMLTALTETSLGNIEGAISNYEKVVKIFPLYFIARFQLAELLIYTGELTKAEIEVKYLLEINSKSAYANLLMSKLNLKNNQFEAALTFAEQAISNGMSTPEALFVAGVSAYKMEKTETARRYLSKASNYLSPNHVANKILAEINLKLGYVDEAIGQIKTQTLTSKNKAVYLSNAAIQQFQKGNFLKATQYISEATDADPENAVNLFKEGFIKLSTNDESGLDDLAEAIKLDTSINEAWLLIAGTHLKNGDSNAAFEIAKTWQQVNLVDGLSLEGYINLQLENTAEAETIFRKILSLDSQHIGATRFLMLISARQGNFSEASILSKHLIERDPSKLSTILTFVNIGIGQEKIDEVQAFLNNLIQQTPKNQAPIVAQSLILAWQKRPTEAIDYLTKMADANDPVVLRVKGDLYLSSGDYEKAYTQYRTWSELYPTEVDSWFKTLDLLHITDDIPKALHTTNEALKHFPNDPRLKALNARYLNISGKVDQARRQYNTVKKYEKQLPSLKLFNGEIALKEKRYKEAKALLNEYYALQPSFETAMLLAKAKQELGEAKEGGALLERELAKMEVKDSWIQIHLVAEYYEENSLLEKSAEIYKTLYNKHPHHFVVVNNYASVLIRQGELDKAEELANVAIQLRPNSPYALDLVGWVLFKQEKYPEALVYISKAHEMLPKHPEVQIHLAEVLLGNNNKSEAQRVVENVKPSTRSEQAELDKLLLKLK